MPDQEKTGHPLTSEQKDAILTAFKQFNKVADTKNTLMVMIDMLAAETIWTLSENSAVFALLAAEMHHEHVIMFIESFLRVSMEQEAKKQT